MFWLGYVMSKDLFGINLICSGKWKRNKLKLKLKK